MDRLKSVIWVGASKKELKAFPRAVQRDFGQALLTGIKTPKENIELNNQRLAQARRIWQEMNK